MYDKTLILITALAALSVNSCETSNQSLTTEKRTYSEEELILQPYFVGEKEKSLLCISQKSFDAIIGFEVTNRERYEANLARPSWPGGGSASGVTIAIGFDLGYYSKADITDSWAKHVSKTTLGKLHSVAGIRGEEADARAKSLANSGVEISWEAAISVFKEKTLPRYARQLRDAYPGVENLPPDAQGALLSLVFNRGTAKSGERRKEMAAIEGLIAANDLSAIAGKIKEMKRIWSVHKLPGLHTRRDEEADLVDQAERRYRNQELVEILVG